MDKTKRQIIKELRALERKPIEANWEWVLQRIKPIYEQKELNSIRCIDDDIDLLIRR